MVHTMTRNRLTRYVSELLLLPSAAVCASASFGRILALAALGEHSVTLILALIGVAAGGVFTVIAVGLLRLPRTLYLIPLALLPLISFTLAPGGVALLVVGATWIAATHLGGVCTPIISVSYLMHPVRDVAERLAEARSEDQVYARSRVEWARHASWRRSGTILLTSIAATVLSTSFDWSVYGWAHVDAGAWVPAGVALALGLLVFQGLVQLLSLRRLWGADPALRVDAELGAPWSGFVVAVAALLLLVALLLPANVSPLYAIDWHGMMDNLTRTLFSKQQSRLARSTAPGIDYQPQAVAAPAQPGADAVNLVTAAVFVIAPVVILLWIAWKILSLVVPEDRERGRGAFRLLAAALLAPFLILIDWLESVRKRLARLRYRAGFRGTEIVLEREDDVYPTTWSATTIRRIFLLLILWATDRGHPRRDEQTVKEYATRLTDNWPHLADDIASVANTYERVRYSAHGAPASAVHTVRRAYERIVKNADASKRDRVESKGQPR